jgi:recombinational DNA repair protein RecT
MARKTVLRRLMKRLPSSTDIDQLVENDNENYDLKVQPAAARAGQPHGCAQGQDRHRSRPAGRA